jgi:hypothetical protein
MPAGGSLGDMDQRCSCRLPRGRTRFRCCAHYRRLARTFSQV